jgi:hypothetical protein
MAKQKRLNKNLVAFLTVMLMVVVISVFTLVVWQQSRRDPEALAQMAHESKQAGDLEEAARRFARAWEASQQRGEPNTKYVIDAAGCLFEMGEIQRWRALLEKTSAREPNDQSLPIALLTGLWHGVEISNGVVWPYQAADLWRDTALKLRQLDEKSVLAGASLARGLWELKGAENIPAGDKAAEEAFQWEPREPRAVLTYMLLLKRRAQDEQNAALTAGAPQAEIQAVYHKYAKQVLDVLGPALEEHPGNVPLVTAYQEFSQGQASVASQAGDASGAAEFLARIEAAFDRALRAHEEQPSPDLCLAAARFKLDRFNVAHPNPAPAELADLRPEIEQITQLAQQVTELDPAVYEGYNLQAELTQRFAAGPDGAELTPQERAAKSLEIYEAAKDRTLTLRNLRVQVNIDGRLLMLRRAFDLVIALRASSAGRGVQVELARAEAFLEDARIKYPEHPATYYMQGQLQIIKNDSLGAIQALTQAYDKAAQYAQMPGLSQARYWFGYLRVNRLPSEQLALLYMNRSQAGEAQRYAEAAVREFAEVGMTPPVGLVYTQAELLRQVAKAQVGKQAQESKAQEALAFLDEYAKTYPDDQDLRAVRVAVLSDLGRPEEAKKLMEQMPDTGTGARLWRAQRAIEQEGGRS